MRKLTAVATALLLGGVAWLLFVKPLHKETVLDEPDTPPKEDPLKGVDFYGRKELAEKLEVNEPQLDVMLREGTLIAYDLGRKFPTFQFKKDGQPYKMLPVVLSEVTPNYMPGSSERFIEWLDTPQTLLDGGKPSSLLKSNSRHAIIVLAQDNFTP